MGDEVLRLLWMADAAPSEFALDAAPFGPFAIEHCAGLTAASGRLGERSFDALLLRLAAADAEQVLFWPGLVQAAPDAAIVLWLDAGPDAQLALRLLQAGVQDVVAPPAGDAASLAEVARSLRLAVERKRIERAARKAYATDLHTGLPDRQQLIEHMSQLLALRGREPAPMALLVIRIEGFATAEAAHGPESARVLRRKLAVRLRAAVRASDVVAALGADAFALLLASTEEPIDAELVARKLQAMLRAPFTLGGVQVAVAASVGVSLYPADGEDATLLLRRAVAAAAAAEASGRSGYANWRESAWQDTGAANDGEVDPR